MVRPPQYKNLINGEWVDSSSGKSTMNVNPADTQEVIGEFPSSSIDDVNNAVATARSAFHSWRLVPAPKRAEILYRAGELLIAQKEELARDMTREMGKVLKEARGDVQEAIDMTYYIAAEGRRLHGHTTPSELPDKFMMSVRIPLGAAAVITPWNFPVAIPVWKIAPALVSGNTVIFKPAELTPLCAVKLMEIFQEAGVPPGVLNLVLGNGKTVGQTIVNHPEVDAISFTGSNEVGCGIYEQGSRRGIRVQCEMGGKNPIVVMEDADIDLAVEGVIQGGFGSTGQRCTAASRLIVLESIAEPFVQKLINRMRKIRIGEGMNTETDIGPLVDEKQMDRVLDYIEIGKEEGAQLVYGGRRLDDPPFDRGLFVKPTLFDHVKPAMRIAREEIFGPVVSVLRVKHFEEAVEVANAVPFGLSASIYTQDIGRAMRFVELADVGKVHINSSTIGGEAQAPFGGTKSTGIGPREQGLEVFEFYTEIKTVYLDYTGKKRDSAFY